MSTEAKNEIKHETLQQKFHSVKFTRTLGKVALRVVVIAIIIVWTIPTVGLLISSFREPQAIQSTGWWTAIGNPGEGQWTFQNYIDVLFADNMGNAFLNSLLVAIPSTVIPITIAAFAAYALAWLKFPGKKVILVFIVGLIIVPLQMSLIPILRLYTGLGLNGTFLGIWLAHTGFGLPLATFLLYGYISMIPGEVLESATVDGATPWQVFTKIMLPLSVPAIASFAIFQFLWVWNDLLVALVFLGTKAENALVTTRLAEIVGSRGQDWHTLTSGAFITMLVPLIVFFSLQRFFVRGLMAGSVKG